MASTFLQIAEKHRLLLEASPTKKNKFVVRGKAMTMSIRLIPSTGDVEVRYGILMPASKAWRYRPDCFENFERHRVCRGAELMFEGGWLVVNENWAMGAFESLCRVFDML